MYTSQLETEIRFLNMRVENLEDEKLSLKRENNKLKDIIEELKERPNSIPDLSQTTNLYGMPTEEE